ncbi:hypothetical protein [Gordonia aichiensis]|uniref:hypothetical protein n=1 Tax=Gordonia aichiensis TaxID=36820 RepID=UPI00326425E9
MTGTAARKPRRAGLFTSVPKSLSSYLRGAGCTLQEIALYMQMYCDVDTSACGYVYRKHEWESIAGCSRETIDVTLRSLEEKELVVVSGPAIILLGYMAEQGFNQPRYLRSGLWDLQRILLDHPLLRFFVGVQLLQLRLVEMETSKAHNLWDAAQSLWSEITGGQELPPPHHMHGNVDAPDRFMVDALATMPEADKVFLALEQRRWLGLPPTVREALQSAFDTTGSAVTAIRGRRTGSE